MDASLTEAVLHHEQRAGIDTCMAQGWLVEGLSIVINALTCMRQDVLKVLLGLWKYMLIELSAFRRLLASRVNKE